MAWLKDFEQSNNLPQMRLLENVLAAITPSKELVEAYFSHLDNLELQGKIEDDEVALLRVDIFAKRELMDLTFGERDNLNESVIDKIRHKIREESILKGRTCAQKQHDMENQLQRNKVCKQAEDEVDEEFKVKELQSVILCLDHDAAGIEANGRLTEILRERGYDNVGILQSEYKDWNEDIKARRGLEAQPSEEHPQLIAAPEICGRIALQSESVRPEYLEKDVPRLLRGYRDNLSAGRMDKAMDCMEQASALALAVYRRELHQLGEAYSPEVLSDALCCRIFPHENHSSLKNRYSELAAQFQGVLVKASASGIRNEAEKSSLAESWLELAVSFAKVPVKYEADILKQQQGQGRTTLQLKMG